MSKDITDSDLQLVQLGKSLGLDLISFVKLRASQEDNFVDGIRKNALRKLAKHNEIFLHNSDSFYAGSIDFMVGGSPHGKSFFLLETNGGSNRGLSILTKKQQALMYDGYFKSISQAIEKSIDTDLKILVLIGVPVNDALIHEKVIMVEYFRKKIRSLGLSLKIFNSDTYDKNYKAKIVFLIADYNQLSKALSFTNSEMKYLGERISVLIGDGIARRFKDEKFIKLIREDYRQINSTIVNPIFKITDDKSLTYLASHLIKNRLEKYNLKGLIFAKAYDEKELIDKATRMVKSFKKSFIIKPNGGSGGAGVIQILSNHNSSEIKKKLDESKKEFYAKFSRKRNPFPYTIQEKADFSLINWEGYMHTFDIRLYFALKKNQIIPIGGLARIARGRYIKGLNKEEFVVNLSGYDGKIEVNRGIGLSEENSKLLNLKSTDIANLFCIGALIFNSMIENYNDIINFADWSKILS
jgi:hypothetical protein